MQFTMKKFSESMVCFACYLQPSPTLTLGFISPLNSPIKGSYAVQYDMHG